MKTCPRHKTRPSVEGCSRCKQCIEQLEKRRARYKAAGLCRCGKEPQKGLVLCSRCLQQSLTKRRQSVAKGLCGCGRSSADGYRCCQMCLDRAAKDREELRKSGMCWCGKHPPVEGRKQCRKCLNRVSAKKAQHRANGKCMCGKPFVENLTKCQPCLNREARRQAERLRTDEVFAITRRIRICIGGAFTRKSGIKRKCRTETLLGCTIPHAKKHIESQFDSRMSWSNHGEWHIDHHIPCEAFDLTKERDQRLCNNWRNLRPLWKEHNFSKNCCLPDDFKERLAELEMHVPHFNPMDDPMF